MRLMKQPIFRSEKWRRAVASMPCVICGIEGQTQAAHRNQGKGMGAKVSDAWCAALCVDCHAAIDQSRDMNRDACRAMMDKAIFDTINLMASEGVIEVRG